MTIKDGFYYPETAVQACVLLGCKFEYHDDPNELNDEDWNTTDELFHVTDDDINYVQQGTIAYRFSLSVVAEVCAAKEGMPVFCWGVTFNDEGDPGYSTSAKSMNVVGWHFLAANAITIGLNVGELRTLMEACDAIPTA